MSESLNTERTDAAMDTKNTVRSDSPIRKGKPKPTDETSLLEMDEQSAAEEMLKDWDKSWKAIKPFVEQWKVNRARSEGYTGVQLIKKQDQQQAYIPTGAKKNIAGMNKASRLSRRIRATLFADPPKPEAIPSRDEDEARDAAETSTRILEDICSEGNLAFNLHAGDAFDLGGDYGSGFIRFWVDETGGGWRPKQLQASPQAVRADDPFPLDELTGQPKPCDPVSRYVTDDGMLTDTKSEAAQEWLPRLKDDVLTGKQVRFLPADVRDLWEADGLQIGDTLTLGELKRIFPNLKKWDGDRLTKLIEYRPQHFKDILPLGKKDTPPGEVTDDAIVFVLTRYHVQSAVYPKGAYLIAAGKDEILHRAEWFDEEHGEPLDIPVTQFKQRTEEGNPYGEGNMTALGPGNELRSAMVGAELDHLDHFQTRQIFLPMTSTLQPQDLLAPTGTVKYILPGGEPKYEELPDFPIVVKEMLAFASADMDDEADLQQAGQGINPTGVNSARHQEVILQQIAAGMSDQKQNVERGLVRGWRIMLQLIRAYYTIPQQVSWVGDDGRYKQQHWTGADLGSTKDVRIAKGSFTGLPPLAKAQIANQYKAEGLLQPAEAEHIIESNLSPVFGLEDNPHRMRVRRQIALWNQGPSTGGAAPANIAPTAASGPLALSQGPTAGQSPAPMIPGHPNQYAGMLAKIFTPSPADDEPPVAMLRIFELGRAMASTKFDKWDDDWKSGMAQSYALARQAANIPDAKMIEGMQQELQKAQSDLNDAKIKLNAANISFSAKMADLDANQTLALLLQEGIQLPPSSGGPPVLDPREELAHKTHIELAKIASAAELKKLDLGSQREQAHIKAAADVEKEKIRGAVKQHTEKLAADREKHVTDKVAEASKNQPKPEAPKVEVHAPITVNIPANKGSKIVRDKKTNAITGTEPND